MPRAAALMATATADGVRECGQLPGTCNAALSASTRQVSVYTNSENALLRSSSNTCCTHPEKTDAQFPLCSATIAWSQACWNHGQSFLCPAERPTFRRERRSRTSRRFVFPSAPPAFSLSSVRKPLKIWLPSKIEFFPWRKQLIFLKVQKI